MGANQTPKLRTAETILEEIQRRDPETELSLYAVRRIIASGALPVTGAGRKKLVDLDAFIALLEKGCELPSQRKPKPRPAPVYTRCGNLNLEVIPE